MANEKITDMTAIVTYADADLLEVVDVSEPLAADQNKKMTKAVLFDSLPDFGNGLSLGDETLDTYDEGTWTPSITFGGASVGVTYGVQSGSYIKIGRMVAIWGDMTLTSKGSSNGNAVVGGLPFTVTNNVNSRAGMPLRFDAIGFTDQYVCLAEINQATIQLAEVTNAGAAATALTDADFNNTSAVFFGGTYQTD